VKSRLSSALPALPAERGEAVRAGTPERAGRSYLDWGTIAKHQAGALASTTVDFGVMIAVVQGVGLSPVTGTVAGAALGAGFNFTLGRRWIFRTGDPARMRSQVLRYGIVSVASLLLNALGEFVVHDRLRVQYVAARLVVAVLVSVAWNYPLHRAWVFAPSRPPEA
jgi:putative flippase GtrA